jgi:hypothetical protein
MSSGKPCGRIDFAPQGKYPEEKRYWQGCPTIARTKSGILYAGWYTGGTKEPSPLNCNILVKSTDNGDTWSDVILAIASVPEEKIRAIDIQLWMDKSERLWAFWTVRNDNFVNTSSEHLSVWAMVCDDPEADELVWSEPRYISPGFLRCQPTLLSDGRILLFAYDWTSEYYMYSESCDNGVTWQRKQGGKKVPTPFDEGMAYEKLDGEIRLFARCDAGAIAESTSSDGGKTWSDGKVTDLTAPSSRLFVKRLPSGNILLVKNNSLPPERKNMTAYLSDDDGNSWKWSLLLDDDIHVSYPDAAISPEGVIYLLHDHCRFHGKEIYISRLTEEDIKAGGCVTPGSCIKKIVSKPPYDPIDQAEYDALRAADLLWLEENKKFNSNN